MSFDRNEAIKAAQAAHEQAGEQIAAAKSAAEEEGRKRAAAARQRRTEVDSVVIPELQAMEVFLKERKYKHVNLQMPQEHGFFRATLSWQAESLKFTGEGRELKVEDTNGSLTINGALPQNKDLATIPKELWGAFQAVIGHV